MKLFKKIVINAELELLTGLHIGGNKESVEIGGIDSPVIRNKSDNSPYIPGSSLKGKMRSLLEVSAGCNQSSNFKRAEYAGEVGLLIAEVFGNAGGNDRNDTGDQSRVIFRDANLTPESKDALLRSIYTDTDYTEIKTENSINRLTGKSDGGLRQFERVPAGAIFSFNLVVNIIAKTKEDADENEKKYLNLIKAGLKLLEDDYLGGCGSRGYGQIKMKIDWEKVQHKTVDEYFKN